MSSYCLTTPLLYWSITPCFFFFNDTATTEIYTLSLHDALPIYSVLPADPEAASPPTGRLPLPTGLDRKSTRLNSSHVEISYAVFCLKKKKSILSIVFVSIFFLAINELSSRGSIKASLTTG